MKTPRSKQLALLLFALSTSGCVTWSGEKLPNVEIERGSVRPGVEHTVVGFSFHLDGGKLVTSNKMGRQINQEILVRWADERVISAHRYVKSGLFSDAVDHRITLSGHQEGESSVFLQVISGLSLYLIPYTVDTQMDLKYTLFNATTGCTFEAEVVDSYKTLVSLLVIPASPFGGIGRDRTFNRIADNLYVRLKEQGAFDPHEPCKTEEPKSQVEEAAPLAEPLPPAPPVREPVVQEHRGTAAQRLRRLEYLRSEGLLSDREYEAKRREILDGL